MSIKKLIVKEEIPGIYQFAINTLYMEIVKSFNQKNLVSYRLQADIYRSNNDIWPVLEGALVFGFFFSEALTVDGAAVEITCESSTSGFDSGSVVTGSG